MDDSQLNPDNKPPELKNFEELDKQADSGNLTRQSLQDELNRYAAAYREEFELASKADPENVEEYTRDFFKQNIHQAAAQIVWLASNAESESVRGNMSKYVIEQATKDAEDAGDPVRALLKKLQNNDATSPAPTE